MGTDGTQMTDETQMAVRAQDLRLAVGRLARRIRQIYSLDREGGATFTEAAILVRLEREGPVSPGELAGREKVTSQAIAAVISELQRRGLVQRGADPRDGRKVIVSITDGGRAVLRDNEQVVARALIRALAGSFTPDELRRLDEAVPLLNRLAETA
jgi:DNA-binding MarR family transcriptional regulator